MPPDGQQGVIPVADLNVSHFAEFFQKLWGNEPFSWQRELAGRVLENADAPDAWPEAIALPTASGKTACMDIAIFALAAQSDRLGGDTPITAPRRIFFVVDRRVIVDQAYDRAKDIAQALSKPKSGGIVAEVADRLKQIAQGETKEFADALPLSAHVLRGGMYRSESWARDPLQPMVVASTVDQVGSRLLFRPYGPSSRTAPIYAGLVANDSLILLDEAHCAQPFMQTLKAVGKYREWAHEPLGRRFYPVIMSATPPSDCDVFTDESEEKNDLDHPLGKRQQANKPAVLKRVAKAKGDQAIAELSKELAKEALDMARDAGQPIGSGVQLQFGTDERIDNRAIVVFVNRVATARETHKLLEQHDDVDAILLTGRMRPLDKDSVIEEHLEDLDSNCSESRKLKKPKIVVATQTLEVGADLDFDGIVTECASLDALRQRFGRLNRVGRQIDVRGVILIRDDQTRLGRNAPPDPVYGEALKETWDWLNSIADGNDEVDFGIAHIEQRLPNADSLINLNAPSKDAPVMLPAHVDCWGQTAPMPKPSPDVAMFLHGPREGAPDVNVCWRADIDLSDEEGIESALESLKLCPPSSPEMLPVPIRTFRRWMAGEEFDDHSGDVEGIESDDDENPSLNSNDRRRVLRWQGVRETSNDAVTDSPSQIRPREVVVVPTNHPSDPENIGSFKLGLDIGDRAHLVARAKPTLRLSQELVAAWPEEADTAKELATALLNGVEQSYNEDTDAVADSLLELLREIPEDLPKPWLWMSDAARELSRNVSTLRQSFHVIGGDKVAVVWKRLMREYIADAETFSDEDDAASSGYSRGNYSLVKLYDHLNGVQSYAKRYAVGCGLPGDLADAVADAGLLHDLGKADPRFQTWLRGGNPWAFDPGDLKSYLAKSPNVTSRSSDIRHEFYSVRLAESSDGLLPNDADLRDLVLHLIASHHGHCRPFAPVADDDACEHSSFELRGHSMSWQGPTNLERLDSGVADRYWRLVRRYGWWGLAWLESIVRLADWRRSEWEETHDG